MDSINVEQVKSIVVDTVEYVKSTDVSAFYADLADKQSTQFQVLTYAILAILVIVVGATWWWNYRGAKQQIKEEMENFKAIQTRWLRQQGRNTNKILQDYQQNYGNDKVELQKSINNQIDRKFKEATDNLKSSFNSFEEIQKEELEKMKEQIENKIKQDQAELCRIFALHCTSIDTHYNAVSWWLSAAKLYKETENDYFLRISIDAAKDALYKVKDVPDDANWDDLIERIKDVCPDTLRQERDIMIKKIQELKDNPKSTK